MDQIGTELEVQCPHAAIGDLVNRWVEVIELGIRDGNISGVRVIIGDYLVKVRDIRLKLTQCKEGAIQRYDFVVSLLNAMVNTP